MLPLTQTTLFPIATPSGILTLSVAALRDQGVYARNFLLSWFLHDIQAVLLDSLGPGQGGPAL